MLEWGYAEKGPVAVRYPRGGSREEYNLKKAEKIKIDLGKGKIVRKGERAVILAFGALLENCQKAAEEFKATLVDMRFVKPLDIGLLEELSKMHEYFITVEDSVVSGGAGSAVNEAVFENNLKVKVKNLGLPDRFLPHGTREEILEEAGLDEEGILSLIKKYVWS
jgi:1-deoxy-D-xylulose-5-phosphate synthase